MYPIQTQDKLFHDGNGTTELGTIVTAEWLNAVQQSLLMVLADGGQSPAKAKHNLLRDAIRSMIQNALTTTGVNGLVEVNDLNTISGNAFFKLTGSEANKPDAMGAADGVGFQLEWRSQTTQWLCFSGSDVYVRSKDNGSDWSAWQKQLIDADVVDDLTSSNVDKPLSAQQGKVLKELIDNKTTLKTIDYYVSQEGGHIESGFYRANGKELNGQRLPSLDIHINHSGYTGLQYARGLGFSYGGAWDVFTTSYNSSGEYLGMRRILTEEGNQTINGNLTLNASGWGKLYAPVNGGTWRWEINPNSATDPRFNFVFQPTSGSSLYASFPTLNKNETIAYQSWVDTQLNNAINSKKSSSVASRSEDTVATSKAVKTAYDKAVEVGTALAATGLSDLLVVTDLNAITGNVFFKLTGSEANKPDAMGAADGIGWQVSSSAQTTQFISDGGARLYVRTNDDGRTWSEWSRLIADRGDASISGSLTLNQIRWPKVQLASTGGNQALLMESGGTAGSHWFIVRSHTDGVVQSGNIAKFILPDKTGDHTLATTSDLKTIRVSKSKSITSTRARKSVGVTGEVVTYPDGRIVQTFLIHSTRISDWGLEEGAIGNSGRMGYQIPINLWTAMPNKVTEVRVQPQRADSQTDSQTYWSAASEFVGAWAQRKQNNHKSLIHIDFAVTSDSNYEPIDIYLVVEGY